MYFIYPQVKYLINYEKLPYSHLNIGGSLVNTSTTLFGVTKAVLSLHLDK